MYCIDRFIDCFSQTNSSSGPARVDKKCEISWSRFLKLKRSMGAQLEKIIDKTLVETITLRRGHQVETTFPKGCSNSLIRETRMISTVN